jgi:hypothetical protein
MSNKFLEECLIEFRHLLKEWRDEIAARREQQLVSLSSSPNILGDNTPLIHMIQSPHQKIHQQYKRLQNHQKHHHKFIPRKPILSHNLHQNHHHHKQCPTHTYLHWKIH